VLLPPSYQFQQIEKPVVAVYVYYTLKLSVKVKGAFADFDTEIPIIIGTEPNPASHQQTNC
jgi:hypothetical protein